MVYPDLRRGHAALLTPSKSSHVTQVLSRPHTAPISPLAATLMDLPVNVANKRLTVQLTPLDAILTKDIGGGGHILQAKSFSLFAAPSLRALLRWFPFVPTLISVPDPSSILRTLFQVPYPLSPAFATLTKTAGVWGYSSHFGTRPSFSPLPAPLRLALPRLSPNNLELTTYNCEVLRLPLAFSSPMYSIYPAPGGLVQLRAIKGLQSGHAYRRQQRKPSGNNSRRLPVAHHLGHQSQNHRPQLSVARALQRFPWHGHVAAHAHPSCLAQRASSVSLRPRQFAGSFCRAHHAPRFTDGFSGADRRPPSRLRHLF